MQPAPGNMRQKLISVRYIFNSAGGTYEISANNNCNLHFNRILQSADPDGQA